MDGVMVRNVFIIVYINIYFISIAPKLKMDFSSVIFDNTNVNTPKVSGTLIIEDLSFDNRLFPPSSIYLHMCFTTTEVAASKCSIYISITYPFTSAKQSYSISNSINSLDIRTLNIFLTDSAGSHIYDKKIYTCIFIIIIIK